MFKTMEKEVYGTPSVEEIIVTPMQPMLVQGSGTTDDPEEEDG